ncbi:MAG: metal ABC transporter ATP-binding protein [Cellulosilyticum sp.]|nr:metal ABC transporter ATP-binding protein [Cellulosilyticum sp.]
MNEILSLKQLSFGYEDKSILENVNLSIKKGDFVAITGVNGAGKSTLLKLILGILSPKQGEIEILGEPMKQFNKWQKVGYLSQQVLKKHQQFPATCEEIVKANLFSQIGFLRFPTKKHKEKARAALEAVGMAGYEKKLIYQLSGGQQQLVMLAHVLLSEPELIILDEPTTGVDQEAITAFYELLKKLNQEKQMTIIMVTHEMQKSLEYVNRQIYLQEKQVLEA